MGKSEMNRNTRSQVLDGPRTPSIDSFRSAMRRVVSGVTVVTTLHEDRPWGMTVTAFTSVSAEPPTVLVCVNSRTVTAADINEQGHFSANLLSQDQLYISGLCSRPGGLKYLDDYVIEPDESPGSNAMPVLRDSLVTFSCSVQDSRLIGSHLVVVGTVEKIVIPEPRTPLLYGEGRYLHGVGISQAPAMAAGMAWT